MARYRYDFTFFTFTDSEEKCDGCLHLMPSVKYMRHYFGLHLDSVMNMWKYILYSNVYMYLLDTLYIFFWFYVPCIAVYSMQIAGYNVIFLSNMCHVNY